MSYLKGWAAVNKLIHTGSSWSGRERNTCFLNLDGSRFADVSAATALDYIDDGRAAALVDWDHDGHLDLWLANRTAPQLRFVHNKVSNDNHFLAVRLQGNGRTVNRDAIGARLELTMEDDGKPLITTLRGGEAALSQSSKWLHFGLGPNDRIKRLVVRWPDGSSETITGLMADTHYQLMQGSGVATRWAPPARRRPLAATTASPPTDTGQSRTVVVGRVPAPELTYRDFDERPLAVGSTSGRGVLVVLWASWCAPCLEELQELAGRADDIRAAGLDVVALSVDSLGDDPGQAASDDRALLRRLAFPYAAGRATDQLVGRLDALQRGLIAAQRPLGVPSSFLIDADGRIAGIHKVRVSVDQLLSDAAMLDADLSARRDYAAPLAGRWLAAPPAANPMNVVLAMIDAGDLEETSAYLNRCRSFYSSADGDPGRRVSPRQWADLQYFLGCVLADQGKPSESCQAFQDALRADPTYWIARYDLGKSLLKQGDVVGAARELTLAARDKPQDPDVLNYLGIAMLQSGDAARAIDLYRQALGRRPQDANILYNLALALQTSGDAAAAVDHYRQSLAAKPGWAAPANNLAWLLATHPDPLIRDGREAVRLAEPMVEATGRGEPAAWDTLAAAYAEAGDFKRAAEAARKALELAERAGQKNLARQIQARLRLFEAGEPFRERLTGGQ
jgi:Flp pilus assembly protein TadD/peroxiredoxin